MVYESLRSALIFLLKASVSFVDKWPGRLSENSDRSEDDAGWRDFSII